MEKVAWIIIDYQNDFANPNTWTLYVNGWEKIAWAINETSKYIKSNGWIIIASRELHPAWHISFASNFNWKEPITECFKRWEEPTWNNFISLEELKNWKLIHKTAWFNSEQLERYIKENWTQALWPEHCVDWTFWAEFYKDLDTNLIDIEVKKWFEVDKHPYSVFWWFTMDSKKSTFELLKERWIKLLKIMWLATDYCDLDTALDWVKNWFEVEFILKATAWVSPSWVVEALEKMRNVWVKILD